MKILFFILTISFFISLNCNAKEYQRFDILGDSISDSDFISTNPSEARYNWANMLTSNAFSTTAGALKSNTVYKFWANIVVSNHALQGATADAWATPGFSLMSKITNWLPQLVVVFIGGNDFLFDPDNFNEAKQEEYRTNLFKIINTLRNNKEVVPDIILVNYYDLFDGRSKEITAAALLQYTNMSEAAVIANQIIKEVSEEKHCYLVDMVFSNFYYHCYGKYTGAAGVAEHLDPFYVLNNPGGTAFDIHPITPGHEKISERIFEKLELLKTLDQSGITIKTNALIFPKKNDILFAGSLTNVAWKTEDIFDNLDGTNLLISKISLHYADSTNFISNIDSDISNYIGKTEWNVPTGSWAGESNYVLKSEVTDSESLTNSQVFFEINSH